MPMPPHGLTRYPASPQWINHETIIIGLINNMPDTALQTTERQYRELLSTANETRLPIRLRLFSLPSLRRGDAARLHIHRHYEEIDELWTSHLDGLIVTGTEPRALALRDEDYWPCLSKLIDWAQDHTISTIWSCLAAHAAVLYLDGIDRHRLTEKLVGVFDCRKAADHPLVVGVPSCWRVPHSRHNGLCEEALAGGDYLLLSQSPDAGADIFVKRRQSLFIFVQGHPEYDPGTLFREYRRDCRRFLTGERTDYPEMPRKYFDNDTATALAEFRQRALQKRDINLLSGFPGVSEEKLAHVWREVASKIYGNWLLHLIERKGLIRRFLKSNAFHVQTPAAVNIAC